MPLRIESALKDRLLSQIKQGEMKRNSAGMKEIVSTG
jgi:hypothetical protein